MNKRQAKKSHKKVIYPIVDELNLLTLNNEEYKQAMDDFHQYAYMHYRYKHYKDKMNIFRTSAVFGYHFPVGEAYKERMETMWKIARRFPPATVEVTQTLADLKEMYKSK